MIQKVFSDKNIAGNTRRNTCAWIDYFQAHQPSLEETAEYSPTVYCGVFWQIQDRRVPYRDGPRYLENNLYTLIFMKEPFWSLKMMWMEKRARCSSYTGMCRPCSGLMRFMLVRKPQAEAWGYILSSLPGLLRSLILYFTPILSTVLYSINPD